MKFTVIMMIYLHAGPNMPPINYPPFMFAYIHTPTIDICVQKGRQMAMQMVARGASSRFKCILKSESKNQPREEGIGI